jgi:hypothetical protein
METVGISCWLATRDKNSSQRRLGSTPQTLSSSDHENFLRVVARRLASKWRRLLSLARRNDASKTEP